MSKINWFDQWVNEVNKKEFIELDNEDKALVRATMYQTASYLVDTIELVRENVPVPVHVNESGKYEVDWDELESISIENCFKCMKWFFENNNWKDISYKYLTDWGEDIQYEELMCPPNIYVDIYHTQLLNVKKYRYKTREVSYEVINYADIKVTNEEGKEEILDHYQFERTYRIEDTGIPFKERDPVLYRFNKIYLYEPRMSGKIKSRNSLVYAEKTDKGYNVYPIQKYHGGECCYCSRKRELSNDEFERLLEPVTE